MEFASSQLKIDLRASFKSLKLDNKSGSKLLSSLLAPKLKLI
jgi:hypothetical protein